jgi:hypothetical protein
MQGYKRNTLVLTTKVTLGGLAVSVLLLDSRCGVRTSQGQQIFKGDKKSIAQVPSEGK